MEGFSKEGNWGEKRKSPPPVYDDKGVQIVQKQQPEEEEETKKPAPSSSVAKPKKKPAILEEFGLSFTDNDESDDEAVAAFLSDLLQRSGGKETERALLKCSKCDRTFEKQCHLQNHARVHRKKESNEEEMRMIAKPPSSGSSSSTTLRRSFRTTDREIDYKKLHGKGAWTPRSKPPNDGVIDVSLSSSSSAAITTAPSIQAERSSPRPRAVHFKKNLLARSLAQI